MLLTQSIRKKLLANGRLRKQRAATGQSELDFIPVVKFFTPSGSACWLLTEIDPDHQDSAFGLCDLGVGFPELGYVSLQELEQVAANSPLSIERDLYFKAEHGLSVYARAASRASMITEAEDDLAGACGG